MCFSGGVLLQVATGEKIAAFALTEPSSGSDAMVSLSPLSFSTHSSLVLSSVLLFLLLFPFSLLPSPLLNSRV